MTDNDDEITLDDLPEIPDDRLCPVCEDGLLISGTMPNRWACENCGALLDGTPPDELVKVKAGFDDEE